MTLTEMVNHGMSDEDILNVMKNNLARERKKYEDAKLAAMERAKEAAQKQKKENAREQLAEALLTWFEVNGVESEEDDINNILDIINNIETATF